jgi:hypothetical protein
MRRAGLRRRDHSLKSAVEATRFVGSPAWIRQDLIRILPNGSTVI